ncbi:MAG: hypothetical protein IRZ33_05280 [Alicyclobacillaceae bacterium]|nr:hypothetical protein [Alicyclobacillaceae bacterium]
MTDMRLWAPWAGVLKYLKASIYAEQVFCSVTTEMRFFPAFAEQPAFRELHAENYETSYHRNTAAGNLIRLTHAEPEYTEPNRRLVVTTIACCSQSREHDRRAEQALAALTASSAEERAFLDLAGKWHEHRKYWLKRAMRLLRAGVPAELWQQGVAKAGQG